jgi:hypothetical protein
MQQQILICKKARLILKIGDIALSDKCEKKYYHGRPISCENCTDHGYIDVKNVPDYINRFRYRTL